MEFGGYDYRTVTHLSSESDLVCKICHLPGRNPHLSSCCGHTFCRSCIDRLKESTSIANACPVCRDSEFPVVQNKQTDRAVRSLHVYCTNEKEGCKWKGEINDIVAHINCCQYESVECENNGCDSNVQRQHLKSHMEADCPYRDVNCQYCDLRGKHLFIEGNHKDECPEYPLPCPNGCEVRTILRKDIDVHRESCSLEVIECEYYNMGCESKMARKDVEDHNRENVNEHLRVLKHELAGTKRNLAQAQKDALNAVKKVVDLQKKFQEQIDDIETQGEKHIKQLETQLYNSICQLHKNWNPWALRLESLAAISISGEQAAPVVLKMVDFAKMKTGQKWWSSDTFYTCNKECKIRLLVYAAGDTDGKTTFLSVCLSLTEILSYDDEYGLPFMGKIEVLNQTANHDHHRVMVDCMVTKNNWMIYREPLFIAHSNLTAVSNTCCFLKNDCLYFQVHMRICRNSMETFEGLQRSCSTKEHATTNNIQSPMQQQEPHPQKEHFSAADHLQSSMQQQKPQLPHPPKEHVSVTDDKQPISLSTKVGKVAVAIQYITSFRMFSYKLGSYINLNNYQLIISLPLAS